MMARNNYFRTPNAEFLVFFDDSSVASTALAYKLVTDATRDRYWCGASAQSWSVDKKDGADRRRSVAKTERADRGLTWAYEITKYPQSATFLRPCARTTRVPGPPNRHG